MELIENNLNIDQIKIKLENAQMLPNGTCQFSIGNFLVQVFTYQLNNIDVVDVVLREKRSYDNLYEQIYIGSDLRFKDYMPIRYEGYNYYDLFKMPTEFFYELVKYLQKLSKLSAFV